MPSIQSRFRPGPPSNNKHSQYHHLYLILTPQCSSEHHPCEGGCHGGDDGLVGADIKAELPPPLLKCEHGGLFVLVAFYSVRSGGVNHTPDKLCHEKYMMLEPDL